MKTNPALVQQHVQMDLQTNREAATDDYEATGEVDFSGKIGKIKAPTLIIMGADDLLITKPMAQFLHENIEGSKLEVIPGAGHVNMLEKPEYVNDVILKFVGS